MRKRKILSIFTLVLFLVAPFILYANRNNIYDWYELYNYKPSDKIIALATDTTMQPSMRRLFYVNRPEIDDKNAFNSRCRSDEETIVLGCYISRQGIFLLEVTDSRLNGIEQVTAAHEALHAAYSRLSTSERRRVDAMTSNAYISLSDARIKDNVKLYRDKDPSVVPNELHSILGTEARSLPADLEQYYKKYFTDRSKIVGYSEQYVNAFTERKNQVLSYDQQLEALKQQIDFEKESLTKQAAQLSADRIRLDNLRSSNQIAAYNVAVPSYNLQVNNYNNDVESLGSLVNDYNDIVPKRNAVAIEESDLAKAIDSRSTVPARQ